MQQWCRTNTNESIPPNMKKDKYSREQEFIQTIFAEVFAGI